MKCQHCGKPVKGLRSTRKYCSDTCKQYAYLKRHQIGLNGHVLMPNDDAHQTDQVYRQVRPQVLDDIKRQAAGMGGYISRLDLSSNAHAITYVFPRLLSVLDNVFYMSYAQAVQADTVNALIEALKSTLLSHYFKALAPAITFSNDLISLLEQLLAFSNQLRKVEVGIKFELEYVPTVRYMAIISVLAGYTERQAFGDLF